MHDSEPLVPDSLSSRDFEAEPKLKSPVMRSDDFVQLILPSGALEILYIFFTLVLADQGHLRCLDP